MRRLLRSALLLAVAACGTVCAQPDLTQRTGTTVADLPSPHYRFDRFVIGSEDGSRRWRVNLAIPRRRAPRAGYPALYALDGNAALMSLDAGVLATLAAAPAAPVLVLIGPDNDLRIDSAPRTRDYTFVLDEPQADAPDAASTGGADVFLDIIERQLRPQVGARVRLDPRRQSLWGHSHGGLLVLYTLFTRPGAFQHYYAASPSLWWHQGAIRAPERRYTAHAAGHAAALTLLLGEQERSGDARRKDDPRFGDTPPDAALQLAQRLKQVPGLSVDYREFAGLGHGAMLPASLRTALGDVSGAELAKSPEP